MKKFAAILLTLILVFSLVSCDKSEQAGNSPDQINRVDLPRATRGRAKRSRAISLVSSILPTTTFGIR